MLQLMLLIKNKWKFNFWPRNVCQNIHCICMCEWHTFALPLRGILWNARVEYYFRAGKRVMHLWVMAKRATDGQNYAPIFWRLIVHHQWLNFNANRGQNCAQPRFIMINIHGIISKIRFKEIAGSSSKPTDKIFHNPLWLCDVKFYPLWLCYKNMT